MNRAILTVDPALAACRGIPADAVRKRHCKICPERWTCLEVGLRQAKTLDADEDHYRYGGIGPQTRRRLLEENGYDPLEAFLAYWNSEGRPETNRPPVEVPADPAPADPATVGTCHPWSPLNGGGRSLIYRARRRGGIVGTVTPV